MRRWHAMLSAMGRSATYNREDALEAALRLFWAKGYHATSLKDLEAALNMKPGSIYAAFQSKEALFRETLDRYAVRMRAELEKKFRESPSPLSVLQNHLTSLGNLTPCDQPTTACMLVKTLLESSADDIELRELVTEHLNAVGQMLELGFTEARAKDEIPDSADPARLARQMQTYIFGLKIYSQKESDPQIMQQLADDLAGMLDLMRTRRENVAAIG